MCIRDRLALRDLFLARPSLDEDDETEADRLLARPTDGVSDPYRDGYATSSVKTCAKHVCVHYVRSGADAPPSTAWAKKTLSVMERVWRHHVGKLDYRKPARDGSRGGNKKFDVYLKEIGSDGLYGYCAPENRVAGKPKQASGFCVLDDDFARSQFARAPIESLKVTAAHEFFHAIQFAYDYTEDPWFLESTATWIEERFADATAPGAQEAMRSMGMSFWNPETAEDGMLWREAHRLRKHTLLTWGREDRVNPLDGAMVALKLIPKAQLHVFPNCGHWAQIEAAAEFAEITTAFLSRHVERPSREPKG